MKFFATVAVIATSVNAHCDFDLTKPTEHWAGNGGIDISPSVKQLNQMKTLVKNAPAELTNTVVDGIRTIKNINEHEYGSEAWMGYFKLKPGVDPTKQTVSCDFKKITMNNNIWNLLGVGFRNSVDNNGDGKWGN